MTVIQSSHPSRNRAVTPRQGTRKDSRATRSRTPSRAAQAGLFIVLCVLSVVASYGEDTTVADVPEVLDLQTAQRLALDQNPGLAAVAERVEQARQRVRQTRSLYFPQLDASYSAAHTELAESVVADARRDAGTAAVVPFVQQEVGSLFTGTTFGITPAQTGLSFLRARRAAPTESESYSASVVASYILFDGFSRHYSHAIAKFGRGESEAGLREARRLLLEAVAQAFHGVQLAREILAINEADEAFNQRQLEDAEARLRVGTGSKSDVLNFEVRLRAAHAALLAAREQLDVARISLATLIGLPEAALPEGTEVSGLPHEPAATEVNDDADALVARAMEMRPDLCLQRLSAQRAKASVGQKRAAFYPTVVLSAAQDARAEDDGRFGSDDFATTVALSASVDLFTGGRNRAALAEARHAEREAAWSLREVEIQVAGDVRSALVGLKTAREQLILEEENADYVRQNRDLVEKEYRAGTGALTRLNQAQRDLIAAQANLALARVALRQARHTLATATGASLEPYGTPED